MPKRGYRDTAFIRGRSSAASPKVGKYVRERSDSDYQPRKRYPEFKRPTAYREPRSKYRKVSESPTYFGVDPSYTGLREYRNPPARFVPFDDPDEEMAPLELPPAGNPFGYLMDQEPIPDPDDIPIGAVIPYVPPEEFNDVEIEAVNPVVGSGDRRKPRYRRKRIRVVRRAGNFRVRN